jgi:hypothetical protein
MEKAMEEGIQKKSKVEEIKQLNCFMPRSYLRPVTPRVKKLHNMLLCAASGTL